MKLAIIGSRKKNDTVLVNPLILIIMRKKHFAPFFQGCHPRFYQDFP